jgi:uncharacterized protein with ParB-like and HNH nuclease domain
MPDTSIHTWTVGTLVSAASHAGDRKLIIPKFQRGIRWPDHKQRELIRSIRAGYPIGSLLV